MQISPSTVCLVSSADVNKYYKFSNLRCIDIAKYKYVNIDWQRICIILLRYLRRRKRPRRVHVLWRSGTDVAFPLSWEAARLRISGGDVINKGRKDDADHICMCNQRPANITWSAPAYCAVLSADIIRVAKFRDKTPYTNQWYHMIKYARLSFVLTEPWYSLNNSNIIDMLWSEDNNTVKILTNYTFKLIEIYFRYWGNIKIANGNCWCHSSTRFLA